MPDGRTVRVHGGLAVMWRKVRWVPSEREEFLRALTEWVAEYDEPSR